MAFQEIKIPYIFIGASTDTKPTTVNVGSRCFEYDTGDWYITRDGVNWVIDTRAGGRVDFGRVSLITSGEVIQQDIKGRAVAIFGTIKRNGYPSWGK